MQIQPTGKLAADLRRLGHIIYIDTQASVL